MGKAGYLLLFDDGPAKGQRIETVIEPNWTRWYCQPAFNLDHGWFDLTGRSPEDPDVTVTRYDCKSSAPSSADCEITVMHFAVAE